MKKQTKYWLKLANEDLAVIQKIIHDPALTNMVAFHAQQAIEKSFKAILEEKEAKVPRIHNLITLFELVKKYIELNDLEIIKELNEAYIETRYPVDLGLLPSGKPSQEKAEQFFKVARKINTQIDSFLSKV